MTRRLRPFLRRCSVPALWSPDPVPPGEPGDAFCYPPEDGPRLVPFFETEHFRVSPSPLPLAKGHVLIVPIQHLKTFSDVPLSWFGELEGIIAVVKRFQAEAYGAVSFGREQGSPPGSPGNRQSIRHAHYHLVPVTGDLPFAARRLMRLGRPLPRLSSLARYRLRHGYYHTVELLGVRRAMPDTGPELEEAERTLRDLLGTVWDPVKLQPTKFEGEAAEIMLGDAIARWNRWVATAGPTPRERKAAKIRTLATALPPFTVWPAFMTAMRMQQTRQPASLE